MLWCVLSEMCEVFHTFQSLSASKVCVCRLFCPNSFNVVFTLCVEKFRLFYVLSTQLIYVRASSPSQLEEREKKRKREKEEKTVSSEQQIA